MKEMNHKMGAHKFRFSGIMPRSWFYKLKGMSKRSRKHLPSSPEHLSSSDASFSRNPLCRLSSTALPQASYSPTKSSSFKRKIKRKTVYKPSPKFKLTSTSPIHSHVSLTSSRNHRSKSSSSANAISDYAVGSSADRVSSPSEEKYGVPRIPESHSIDINDDHSVRKLDDVSEDPSISANSSPVLVETVKESPYEMKKQQKLKNPSSGSTGIRIRAKSPKIARKKTKGRMPPESKNNMGAAESFAIVMSSTDPERDFRQSMVEMIVENKMKEPKDLEDLLACYLSLNSSEYHGVIIKAFEKTWLHLNRFTGGLSPCTPNAFFAQLY